MAQLISVIISFLSIPIFIKFKMKLSYTLLISAGILSIISGLGFETIWEVILSIFTNPSSRATILTVMMVSILGRLMKHYKILDKIVDTMLLVIRSKKNILMIIPAIIGILVIPGGALLSAPFINNIGEEMNIPRPRRAVINLVFRHIAMFILPYSTSLLIVSASLPSINIPKLILLNLFFVIFVIIIGYFFFLRDIPSDISTSRKNIGKNLLKLLVYTSPIYIAVILNSITGLPFYITLVAGVFIAYLLSDKEDFSKILVKSINWNTVLSVTAILIIKEIILNMDDLLKIFNNMFNASNNILSMMIIFFISSFFFGYITGNQTAALAIILPMISQLHLTDNMLYIYTYFAYGSTFMGYFFSPIHLCQAFTLEHMGVSTEELYKEYRLYMPTLLFILIISVFVFKLILT